jgi:hypothetical protein
MSVWSFIQIAGVLVGPAYEDSDGQRSDCAGNYASHNLGDDTAIFLLKIVLLQFAFLGQRPPPYPLARRRGTARGRGGAGSPPAQRGELEGGQADNHL